jgi:hypothetical protein
MDQVVEAYLLHRRHAARSPGELLAQLSDAEATEPDEVGKAEIPPNLHAALDRGLHDSRDARG